jgi:hypothetical protein
MDTPQKIDVIFDKDVHETVVQVTESFLFFCIARCMKLSFFSGVQNVDPLTGWKVQKTETIETQ